MKEYKFHGNKKLLIQKFKQYSKKFNITSGEIFQIINNFILI